MASMLSMIKGEGWFLDLRLSTKQAAPQLLSADDELFEGGKNRNLYSCTVLTYY